MLLISWDFKPTTPTYMDLPLILLKSRDLSLPCPQLVARGGEVGKGLAPQICPAPLPSSYMANLQHGIRRGQGGGLSAWPTSDIWKLGAELTSLHCSVSDKISFPLLPMQCSQIVFPTE